MNKAKQQQVRSSGSFQQSFHSTVETNVHATTMSFSTSDPEVLEQFRQFLALNYVTMYAYTSHLGLSSSSTLGIPSSLWILDSVASHHMSP